MCVRCTQDEFSQTSAENRDFDSRALWPTSTHGRLIICRTGEDSFDLLSPQEWNHGVRINNGGAGFTCDSTGAVDGMPGVSVQPMFLDHAVAPPPG